MIQRAQLFRPRRGLALAVWLALAGQIVGGRVAAGAATAADAAETVISFAQGQWETNRWMAVRMANQAQPFGFTQYADSIGTATNTFSSQDYNQERDNALLVYDTGTTEGEIELTFRIGRGFTRYSSPGICISPRLKDGVFENGIAIFVATSVLAVWYEYTGEDGRSVRYRHLIQLARYTAPEEKHVLKCRYSKKNGGIAIQLDDADVVAFMHLGHKRLSAVPHEINSLIAVWGCHGACNFYELKARPGGTLSFYQPEPASQPTP